MREHRRTNSVRKETVGLAIGGECCKAAGSFDAPPQILRLVAEGASENNCSGPAQKMAPTNDPGHRVWFWLLAEAVRAAARLLVAHLVVPLRSAGFRSACRERLWTADGRRSWIEGQFSTNSVENGYENGVLGVLDGNVLGPHCPGRYPC